MTEKKIPAPEVRQDICKSCHRTKATKEEIRKELRARGPDRWPPEDNKCYLPGGSLCRNASTGK